MCSENLSAWCTPSLNAYCASKTAIFGICLLPVSEYQKFKCTLYNKYTNCDLFLLEYALCPFLFQALNAVISTGDDIYQDHCDEADPLMVP